MNLAKHSLWFVSLLIVSLAIKFHRPAEPFENPETTLKLAASILQDRGYAVQSERIGNGRLSLRRGDCVAQLRLMDSHATADDFYRSTLQPNDEIWYVWRGQWHASRPIFGPLLEFYIKREFVRRNIAMNRLPLWVAGIGKDCGQSIPAAFSAAPLSMQPKPR